MSTAQLVPQINRFALAQPNEHKTENFNLATVQFSAQWEFWPLPLLSAGEKQIRL